MGSRKIEGRMSGLSTMFSFATLGRAKALCGGNTDIITSYKDTFEKLASTTGERALIARSHAHNN